MLKKYILPLALLASLFCACNSSSDDDYQVVESSDVAVTAFSLFDDSKVLDSLSNVFFSIDLENARIFNADSLPFGTRVNRLVPIIKTRSASAISIEFPRAGGLPDSIVNYKESSTDSIDFSNGPVKLRITSQNGNVERLYEVRVNVHRIKPDTLAWQVLQSADLPSQFANPKAHGAARTDKGFYSITSSASGDYCLVTIADPNAGNWQVSTITPGFDADPASLRATHSALYMLSSEGSLFTSTDGTAWSDTGEKMSYLYGAYGDDMMGYSDGNVKLYPSRKSIAAPEGFPVKGTSLPASYAAPMEISQQIVLIGGIDADGSLSRNAWGFDGSNLMCLSRTTNLPEGLEGMSLVAYDLFRVPSSTWAPVQYPALVALGGRKADGTLSRTVYISKDWGLNWSKAPELMQLPADMPSFMAAPAFVYSVTMHLESRTAAWDNLNVKPLYPWAVFIPSANASRAVAPITEWECPGIYLIGALNADGAVMSKIWRGVITRYTFCPVQ